MVFNLMSFMYFMNYSAAVGESTMWNFMFLHVFHVVGNYLNVAHIGIPHKSSPIRAGQYMYVRASVRVYTYMGCALCLFCRNYHSGQWCNLAINGLNKKSSTSTSQLNCKQKNVTQAARRMLLQRQHLLATPTSRATTEQQSENGLKQSRNLYQRPCVGIGESCPHMLAGPVQ